MKVPYWLRIDQFSQLQAILLAVGIGMTALGAIDIFSETPSQPPARWGWLYGLVAQWFGPQGGSYLNFCLGLGLIALTLVMSKKAS